MTTTGEAPSGQERDALARFLRSRRERIDPTSVGLPPRNRRRTPGLRREDVSVLAGVSPTWYAYLEQGRDINPSPALLDSIARVLRCTEQERQYMHVLAYGRRPATPHPDLTAATTALCELVALFEHLQYPVYAFDDIADLIGWNSATADWYDDFDEVQGGRPNMLIWLLTSETARKRLVNWAEDCRDIVARYRSFVAARHQNPRIARFIEELRAESPEFKCWWDEQEVRGQARRPRVFRHPERGVRRMYIQVLVPTESDDLRVAFHLPAPGVAPEAGTPGG